MNWPILAVIAPLCFTIYQSLIKLLPPGISIFLVNAYAFLIGSFIMLSIHLLAVNNKTLSLSFKSFYLTLGIGILVTFGNFLIIKCFVLGASQSIFAIIFNTLYIIYGILFGILFWQEKLNFYQIGGILLTIIGIIIVFHFKK